jgi:hypothetical protein
MPKWLKGVICLNERYMGAGLWPAFAAGRGHKRT